MNTLQARTEAYFLAVASLRGRCEGVSPQTAALFLISAARHAPSRRLRAAARGELETMGLLSVATLEARR